MMHMRQWLAFGMMTLASLSATGQAPVKKIETLTGTVSGVVTCADTNAPARFALVTLEPVPTEKTSPEDAGKGTVPIEPHKKTMNEMIMEQQPKMNGTATTDLDGHFALEKIPPGRYYVVGILAGYLNPLAKFDQDQLKSLDPDTRKLLAKVLPIVEVEANQAAGVTLRLERAAELGGTVLYEDGSPAVGMHVRLLRKNKDGKLNEVSSAMNAGMTMGGERTDDRGRYRAIGVPAGEYAVRMTLPLDTISVGTLLGEKGGYSFSTNMNQGESLDIYSGDKFRQTEATTVKVGDGEQVAGLDITIQLSGLHSVRGSMTATRDGHALSQGKIELLYADDKTVARSARLNKDGSFAMLYIPEGSYILKGENGADVEFQEPDPLALPGIPGLGRWLRGYADAEMPLLVKSDVTGADIGVSDKKKRGTN